MKIHIFVVIVVVAAIKAHPTNSFDTRNVVAAPPNCEEGQELIDGECRDIWRKNVNTHNVVTVPTNCPPGQELINGVCRDIWSLKSQIKNVVSVPPNCPENQEYINGQCRDIWRWFNNNNVVSFPPNCAPEQEYINGQCRNIFRNLEIDTKNVITVPPNCPDDQEYIDGECRDIWIKNLLAAERMTAVIEKIAAKLGKSKADILSILDVTNNKNIISVPNQCPAGSRPDSLGNCRPIWS